MRARWVLLLFVAGFCSAGTRRAVLIGINQYNPPGSSGNTAPAKNSAVRKGLVRGDVRHWKYPDLSGAIADVNLIEGLLLAPEFGFQPGDIVKLVTPEQTTAEAILAALRRELVETAGKDDVRLVYYSGHGNFIRNAALEKKENKFDQTIVPSDHWQGAVDVRDKELAQILWDSAKKGVTVTFIADSCHSGSLTRGPANVRGTPRSNSGARGPVNGVTFAEPVVDDAPAADGGSEINPEEKGVLTLAAAQENQEALEIWDEKDGTHGGMTMALVRAIREEGPHASMNRIFERMLNYMQAANLRQTPVLGGVGRAEKDLLGQAARQEPFSVLVKDVREGEALLGAGEAIGLYEGSELRRVGGGDAKLTVVKSLGLTEAAAKIDPAGAAVAKGDRFAVSKWAAPSEPVLKVYVPEAAPAEVITRAAGLAALRNESAVHWVEDPTVESPNAILRWSAGHWLLDRIASDGKTSDLGAAPTAGDVEKTLAPGARLFVWMPPSAAVSAAVGLGEGTHYPGIVRLKASDAAKADYRLYGRLTGSGVEYAWVQADADVSSRGGARLPSSLPARTDWFHGTAEDVGATLTEYAVRIGKVRGWLNLVGRPGTTEFPYRLVLRKVGSNVNAKPGTLYGGEQYNVFLQLDPAYRETTTPRRWVYVFVIDQHGSGKLVFPVLGRGNEGNHLPRADKDEAPAAPPVPLISMRDRPLKIRDPWGTDTYVVISTKDPIPHPDIFQFDGVQSSRGITQGPSGNALEDLLNACGDATRGGISEKAPSEWSIERVTFQTAPAK